MKEQRDEKWLDELIARSIDSGKLEFDPEKWKEKYPEEFQMLKSRAGQTSGSPVPQPNVWRVIMTNRITKLVTAAVIIIAVAIGLYHYTGSLDGASLAWAEVIERIKNVNDINAQSWRKFTIVGEHTPVFEGKVLKYFSRELGYVEEQYVGERCVLRGCGLFPQKKGVIILPDLEKYFEFELNEKLLLLADKLNPMDPTGMTEIFDQIEYKRLGFRKIDGTRTEGFEIKGFEIRKNEVSDNFLVKRLLPIKNLTVRFWVDVETSLPIEIEAEGVVGKGFLTGFKTVVASELVHDIKWGAKIDPNIFELNIPEGYNLMPNDCLERDAEH